MAEETYLIAGLGNPGPGYEDTRHNIGFLLVDAFARQCNVELNLTKWDAQCARVSQGGDRLFLLKPQTYMNLSGTSVARYADFYKIPTDHILICHDDLDMHPGRLKLVAGGGPGGHNGIRSLIQCLGSKDFFRLKYGIGKPGDNDTHQQMPVEKYVLAQLSSSEHILLEKRMGQIVEGLEVFLEQGSQQAMNSLNGVK